MRKPAIFFLFVLASGIFFNFGHQKNKELQESQKHWSLETHDQTNFPLTGRHRIVPCIECHLNNVFEGTPTACEACHWDRSQDDRYQLQLGTHCGECHTPFSWKPVPTNKWSHEFKTGYRLSGAHRTLDCIQCHMDENFSQKERNCYTCHENEYKSSRNPDHIAAGFSIDCWICHLQESSWIGAKFDHSLFLLKGKHKLLRCSDCHESGIYQGLPSTCAACHLKDYNNAKEPDHKQAGFPTDCEICHSSEAISWEGATFTHSTFPLKGRHFAARCTDCHKNNIYAGLPSACVFCHLDDYLNAKNPNHKQLGFHSNCEVCHGTEAISWNKTIFNHDLSWPLRGAHRLLNCVDCHSSADIRDFSCLNCHSHEKRHMDKVHLNETGYIYQSQACLGCHFQGKK